MSLPGRAPEDAKRVFTRRAHRSTRPRGPKVRIQYAVLLGDALFGIAQDGIIQIERPGEPLVFIGRIDAGGEVRDFQIVKHFAVFAERLAFRRAAFGKRLGKPRDHNRTFPP